MFEFGAQLYVTVILILTVLLIGMLIERFKIPKQISKQVQAQTQRQQQQYKQEMDLLKKQHQKHTEALKAQAESAFAEDRTKTDRVLSELEREREISKIASTVSNEQIKKIQFFTDLAHEFRNPLSEIMESLEELLSGSYGKLQVKTRKQLEVMLRNTRILLRGMDLFHDVSHLQLGKMEIARTKQDLVRFLREIVQSVAWYAEKKKINLRLETHVDEVDIFFDAAKMAEVLYHLISNAFKFSGVDGKILISVSELPPNEDTEEDAVQIKIRNNGKPIPEEEIPYLFDPFYRTERNRPRFGLTIVKELISQHGGTIRVRSEPDIGTEFTILLPKGRRLESGEEEAPPAKSYDLSQRAKMELSMLESEESRHFDDSDTPEAPAVAAGKILIVEDNRNLRELLKGGLREYYAVTEAENGMEALEKINEHRPDLIITDLMMPGLDGLNLCRQLKQDPAFSQIPIILITAKSPETGRIEGMEAGADAYIAKPFGLEELLRKIEQLTKRSLSNA
jgi:signal transduction histidine kinase/CheY-like chemotaxis protein